MTMTGKRIFNIISCRAKVRGTMMENDTISTSTNDVTVQLASKESCEHMIGMEEVYEEFRKRPMIVRAHDVDTPVKITTTTNIVKTIHFIRHGQGFHNLIADIATEHGTTWKQFDNSFSTGNNRTNPYVRPEVLDAPLTELGRQQAQQLHSKITTNAVPIDSIYVSPHCRTLQTGLIAFQHCVGGQTSSNTNTTVVELVAHELLREESGIHVCDQRRPISWQTVEFPQYKFQQYCTIDIDPLFQDHVRETKFQVADRIYQFIDFLSQQDHHHQNIAVITHSNWLHILFNAIIQKDDSYNPKYTQWFNTGEMRSVQLEFILRDELGKS